MKKCTEKDVIRFRKHTDTLSEFLNKYSDKFDSDMDFDTIALWSAKFFARLGIIFDFYNEYNFLNNIWHFDENLNVRAYIAINKLRDDDKHKFIEDFNNLVHGFGFKYIIYLN